MTIAQPLPQFSAVNPATVHANIAALIAENQAAVEQVLATGGPYTWQNLVLPLDEVSDKLTQAWQPVAHMNAVVSNDELRAAHDGLFRHLSRPAELTGLVVGVALPLAHSAWVTALLFAVLYATVVHRRMATEERMPGLGQMGLHPDSADSSGSPIHPA